MPIVQEADVRVAGGHLFGDIGEQRQRPSTDGQCHIALTRTNIYVAPQDTRERLLDAALLGHNGESHWIGAWDHLPECYGPRTIRIRSCSERADTTDGCGDSNYIPRSGGVGIAVDSSFRCPCLQHHIGGERWSNERTYLAIHTTPADRAFAPVIGKGVMMVVHGALRAIQAGVWRAVRRRGGRCRG
jgi:hypothetical protein